MLIDKNACGVIVNVGKYLFEETIAPDVLALCNEKQFPLITMPWKYHLADILQEYSRQIFFRTHEQDRLIYIFQMLLQDATLYSPEDETRLRANNFDPGGTYCAAVLGIREGGRKPTPELARELTILIENQLNRDDIRSIVFPFCNQWVLVFHNLTEHALALGLDSILSFCAAREDLPPLVCGVGSLLTGAERVQDSYRRATEALDCALMRKKTKLSFGELGVFQLFFTCRDPDLLRGFTEILRPLARYDAQNGSDMLETLHLYLAYGGKVNLVSDALFCHRNTINYRMKKIKALLHCDLEDSQTFFQLELAFRVREYLAMTN
jgi:hypothetical protein